MNPQQGIMSLTKPKQRVSARDSRAVDQVLDNTTQMLGKLDKKTLGLLLQLTQYLKANKPKYKELMANLEGKGALPPGVFPDEYNPKFLSVFALSVAKAQQAKNGMAAGGIAGIAQTMKDQGRGKDTMLAHISPEEAELLEKRGGVGTMNPATGLPEYGIFDDIGNALSGVGNAVGSVLKPVGDLIGGVLSSPLGMAATAAAAYYFMGPSAGAVIPSVAGSALPGAIATEAAATALTPAAIEAGIGSAGYGYNASAAASGLFDPAMIGSGAGIGASSTDKLLTANLLKNIKLSPGKEEEQSDPNALIKMLMMFDMMNKQEQPSNVVVPALTETTSNLPYDTPKKPAYQQIRAAEGGLMTKHLGIGGLSANRTQTDYAKNYLPGSKYRPGQGGVTYFTPMKYGAGPVTPVEPTPTPVDELVNQTIGRPGGGGGMDSESRAAMLADTAKRMDAWEKEDPEGYKKRNNWIGELFNGSLLVQLAKLAEQGIDKVKQTWADNRLKALGIDPKIVLANQNTIAGTSMQDALNKLQQQSENAEPGDRYAPLGPAITQQQVENAEPGDKFAPVPEDKSFTDSVINQLIDPYANIDFTAISQADEAREKAEQASIRAAEEKQFERDTLQRELQQSANLINADPNAKKGDSGTVLSDRMYSITDQLNKLNSSFSDRFAPSDFYAGNQIAAENLQQAKENLEPGDRYPGVPAGLFDNQFLSPEAYQAEVDKLNATDVGAGGVPYGTSSVPPGVSANQFAANYAAYNNSYAPSVPYQDTKFVEGKVSPSSLMYGPNPDLVANINDYGYKSGLDGIPPGISYNDFVKNYEAYNNPNTLLSVEEKQKKELEKIIQSFLSDTPENIIGTGTALAGTDYTGGIPSTTIGNYSFGTEPSGPDTSGFNLGSLDANGMLKTFPGATDQTDLPSLLNPTQFPDLGMITTQNVVYGPDGTAYNTPAYAMAAGVYNYTNTPPTSGQGLASLSASYGGLGSVWRGADGMPIVGSDGKPILTSQGAAENAFNASPAGLTAANVAETKSLLNRYPAFTTTETPAVDTTPVADISFSDALMAAMLSQPTVEAASPIQSWTASLNNGITSDAGSGTFSAPSDSGNYSGSFGNVQAPGEAGRGSAPAPAPSAPSDGGNYSNEGRNSAPPAPAPPSNDNYSNEGRNSEGGGRGGGGGGRVICTHFYRKGEMSRDMWRSDLEFTFKNLSPTTVRGYQYWAIPYVKLMRKSKLAENIMRPLAMHRAKELSYQMGRSDKGSWFGKAVRLIGEPICFTVGLFVGEQNWQSLWKPAKD